MSLFSAPLAAIDEVRQANRLFLGFLQARPALAAAHFGLPAAATALLGRVGDRQIERAAGFPRALFRLSLPAETPAAIRDPVGLTREPDLRVLGVTLLMTAWNLSRTSAYSARLLLRLDDAEIERLRQAEMRDLLLMSLAPQVVGSAFDDLAAIYRQVLTEARPERRRHLLLLGLQPDAGAKPLAGTA